MSERRPKPSFIKVARSSAPDNPEALFTTLPRNPSHGYLRGEQQELLRAYAERALAVPDLALELPTGTGKSLVGLLIADWARRTLRQPTAFLTVTNQLGHQVIAEAERVGIPVANLIGNKSERSPAEEGKFTSCTAIGVSHYSNLFNSNPVIANCGLLVLDDAHGGESYVADNWTVRVRKLQHRDLYDSLLSAARPMLTASQWMTISTDGGSRLVELCDLVGQPGVQKSVTALLDDVEDARIRFPWRNLRASLHACVCLVSRDAFVLRPVVPPTHTHPPFADARQRVYMSATLGSIADLQRAFGVRKIEPLSVGRPQWGRRYIFAPERWATEGAAAQVIAEVWNDRPQRAVILAPSQTAADEAWQSFSNLANKKPKRITADDIEEDLGAFVKSQAAVLTLAGRYDGLDLPDDDCRLLVMHESPAAINEFERHLQDSWKMGPLLRGKERTRLIQGLGRCTRNSTDYAVVFWTGPSLISATANPSLLNGLPPELRAELLWGLDQSQKAEPDPSELANMALGLLEDADYRGQANSAISEMSPPPTAIDPMPADAGKLEVQYAAALWDEDYPQAYAVARQITDQASAPELAGYRAWWWYLASIPAHHLGNSAQELDCFQRGVACGVNRGRLVQIQRRRPTAESAVALGIDFVPNAQEIWSGIERLGWVGQRFGRFVDEMLALINQDEANQLHEGIDRLGSILGLRTTRVTSSAAPDVVWQLLDNEFLAFEAKSSKTNDSLSVKELREAGGHASWIRTNLAPDVEDFHSSTVVIGPSPNVADDARPFMNDLFFISVDSLRSLAAEVAEAVRELRVEFSGSEFSATESTFAVAVTNAGLGTREVATRLCKERLATLNV